MACLPTAMGRLDLQRPKARLDLQRADTAAAIVHWATRLAAPAVRQVAAAELPPCTGAPQLVLRAPWRGGMRWDVRPGWRRRKAD